MLEGWEPGLLDQWDAFYEAEPWGDEWLRSAAICHFLRVLIAVQQARGGVSRSKISIPKLEDLLPTDVFGPDESDAEKKGEPQSEEERAAAINKSIAQATAALGIKT